MQKYDFFSILTKLISICLVSTIIFTQIIVVNLFLKTTKS